MSTKKNTSIYQPPTITRMQSAHHSKGGMDSGGGQRVRTDIDGATIDQLTAEHGSPLFVYSEKKMLEKYQAAKKCFTELYPDVVFAWSYKTNYLRGICDFFHKQGSIAEVVSEFEYEKARHLGIPGNQIIYNGPLKSRQSLERAAAEKAYIHLDNFGEIDLLEQIAAERNETISVAIRLNMDSGIKPLWTRFGFNLESGQAMDAVQRILLGKRLKLVGLHTHIGTFVLDPNCYATASRKVAEFATTLLEKYGIAVDYLDMGGGFPSLSQLIGIYQSPDVSVPPIEAFAKAICDTLKEALPRKLKPRLFIEAGRHFVDEAGFLITTVCARKLMPDGAPSYVLDAGVNLLYTARWYRFTFEVDRELKGPVEYSVLHGPLCMNIDVVCDYLTLPPLPRGTRLILSPVGAYNLTQSMQFIQYRPAVVMVRANGTVETLRAKERLESVEFDETQPKTDKRRALKAA